MSGESRAYEGDGKRTAGTAGWQADKDAGAGRSGNVYGSQRATPPPAGGIRDPLGNFSEQVGAYFG